MQCFRRDRRCRTRSTLSGCDEHEPRARLCPAASAREGGASAGAGASPALSSISHATAARRASRAAGGHGRARPAPDTGIRADRTSSARRQRGSECQVFMRCAQCSHPINRRGCHDIAGLAQATSRNGEVRRNGNTMKAQSKAVFVSGEIRTPLCQSAGPLGQVGIAGDARRRPFRISAVAKPTIAMPEMHALPPARCGGYDGLRNRDTC